MTPYMNWNLEVEAQRVVIVIGPGIVSCLHGCRWTKTGRHFKRWRPHSSAHSTHAKVNSCTGCVLCSAERCRIFNQGGSSSDFTFVQIVNRRRLVYLHQQQHTPMCGVYYCQHVQNGSVKYWPLYGLRRLLSLILNTGVNKSLFGYL